MPSKKKKYNSRFPPARIKKIMQTDEEIGKVAAAVPVLISKCLEMFLASLLTKAGEVTKSKRAKTMSRTHLKQCIMTEAMFDFLKDHVANIPDVQNDDEPSGSLTFPTDKEPSKKVDRKRSLTKVKKTPKKRAKLGHPLNNNNESEDETDSADDGSGDGSGPEGSDAMFSSSFSSPGLISPSVQSKLDSQSSSRAAQNQEEGQSMDSADKTGSFHIPLDALMSDENVPAAVEINKPLQIVTSDDADPQPSAKIRKKSNKVEFDNSSKLLSSQSEAKTFPSYSNDRHSTTGSSHVSSPPQSASAVRQGVIVANTVAYPSATPTLTTSPIQGNSLLSASATATPKSSTISKVESQTQPANTIPKDSYSKDNQPAQNSSDKDLAPAEKLGTRRQNEPDSGKSNKTSLSNSSKMDFGAPLPPVMPPPQPGSMLSFLYSSMSMPISSINMSPTVPQAPSQPQTQYAYSPLSQHRKMKAEASRSTSPPVDFDPKNPQSESDKSVQDSGTSKRSPIQASYSVPHPYRYTIYNPAPPMNTAYSSQPHFLGYPQSILTPPGHPVPGMNSHLSAHASLSMAKPKPKSRVDDDDDYDA